jgi:hypothetical protein
LEKPRFLVENFVVWAYRDPYHLFFTFERGFQKIQNLGPSIFNTEIYYYNQSYNFKNRIIAEIRNIFKHMEKIQDLEKRKIMKYVANFFDVSFQKTLLSDKPFGMTDFEIINSIQCSQVKKTHYFDRINIVIII